MPEIILVENPFDKSEITHHQANNICDFLHEKYGTYPAHARIYEFQNDKISQERDITPIDEQSIDYLYNLKNPVCVVFYPGDPATIVTSLIVTAINFAVSYFLAPSAAPNAALRTQQATSPNNELSERSNQPRVNGRIPDIFGTVRSTPDLLGVPLVKYENNQEVEISYMCVGRGSYEVSDIRDAATLISDIDGASVEVYGPNTSPNTEGGPFLRIGAPIDQKLVNVEKSGSVNGQVMRPPNTDSFTGSSNIRFTSPNKIELAVTSTSDFTDKFAAGDDLIITNATHSGNISLDPISYTGISVICSRQGVIKLTGADDFSVGERIDISNAVVTTEIDLSGSYTVAGVLGDTIWLATPDQLNQDWKLLTDVDVTISCDIVRQSGAVNIDLSGTYKILSVAIQSITLASPSNVNPDWALLGMLDVIATDYISPALMAAGDHWIGPFVFDIDDLKNVYCNFIALNGIYRDTGSARYRLDVAIDVELTPLDENGQAILGAEELFQVTLEGSKAGDTRARTLEILPTFSGPCQVRARRSTPKNTQSGTIVDEVKFKDLFGISPIADGVHYGDITTIQSITYATSGALSLKQRKLNLLAARKVKTRISGDEFTDDLFATSNFADIFCHICLDEKIGNRQLAEIDLDNIYQTQTEIEQYFSSAEAIKFNYTFDKPDLSFEETISSVANAVFCTAARSGSEIFVHFERSNPDSTLLFNHRNKVPGTETRSVSFGQASDYDGVELEYVDPVDDLIETYYIPEDQTAINPKKIQTIGIRTREQAFWHAWRSYSKLAHQNMVTEFTALDEASVLVLTEAILVSDNTRPETMDGEIEDQNGLALTLSQDVDVQSGSRIWVQHTDGFSESLPVAQGDADNEVILTQPPRQELSLDPDNYARATFAIVPPDISTTTKFLVAEKTPSESNSFNIKAINYSDRYYEKDTELPPTMVTDEQSTDPIANPVSYVGSESSNDEDVSTLAVAFPSGIQADDILIAYVVCAGTTALTDVSADGWERAILRSDTIGRSGCILWKRAVGDESGNEDFSLTGGNGLMSVVMTAWRGVVDIDVPYEDLRYSNGVSGSVVSPATINTLRNSEIIHFAFKAESGALTIDSDFSLAASYDDVGIHASILHRTEADVKTNGFVTHGASGGADWHCFAVSLIPGDQLTRLVYDTPGNENFQVPLYFENVVFRAHGGGAGGGSSGIPYSPAAQAGGSTYVGNIILCGGGSVYNGQYNYGQYYTGYGGAATGGTLNISGQNSSLGNYSAGGHSGGYERFGGGAGGNTFYGRDGKIPGGGAGAGLYGQSGGGGSYSQKGFVKGQLIVNSLIPLVVGAGGFRRGYGSYGDGGNGGNGKIIIDVV